jgi:hypothetical protein
VLLTTLYYQLLTNETSISKTHPPQQPKEQKTIIKNAQIHKTTLLVYKKPYYYYYYDEAINENFHLKKCIQHFIHDRRGIILLSATAAWETM